MLKTSSFALLTTFAICVAGFEIELDGKKKINKLEKNITVHTYRPDNFPIPYPHMGILFQFQLRHYLSHDHLRTDTEEEIFDAVLDWCKRHDDLDKFPSLAELIR